MTHFLIVESKSPLLSARQRGIELALEAIEDANTHVTLWLFEDAPQMLQLADQTALSQCVNHDRISVHVDDFAVGQRGIDPGDWPQIKVSGMDVFAKQLLDSNTIALWH